jgi:Cu/Ag efflux protein CusF
MKRLTMPFNVSDSLLLEGIHPKDSVKIFIDYDGTNVVLKKLKNSLS